MTKVFINDKLCSAKTASISIFDRGLLYGDGLFETIRLYNGKPFMLTEHLERLSSSAKKLNIPVTRLRRVRSKIEKLLKANNLHKSNQACIRITLTRGIDPILSPSYRPSKRSSSTLIITARRLDINKIKKLQLTGIKTTLLKGPSLTNPGLKSLNFLPAVRAAITTQDKGVYEVIFNDGKYITECSAANIFIVKNKSLITPKANKSTGILPGITRALIIKTAKGLGIKVLEAPVKISELKSVNEAFITNSLIEIVPIIKIDRKKIAHSKASDITHSLQLALTIITDKL
jgi:branched-chain amino acid aminotransferase